MTFAPISNALSYAVPIVWAAALMAFLRSRKKIPVPALGIFLAIRTVSAFLLLGASHAQGFAPALDPQALYSFYLYAYWATWLAACVALFFTLRGIFRHVMAQFPNLSRLGLIAFRWAAVVSLIIYAAFVAAVIGTTPVHARLATIFAEISGSFSLLELCLLAFVAVSIASLHLPFRSWPAGICTGLGILAVMNLATSSLRISGFYFWSSQIYGAVTIVALLVWIGYMLAPQTERTRTADTNASSNLLQWNDVAQEIGTATQPQPAVAQGGFLQNVESVVDRVLAKNSLGNAS